jgi:hypothetical protein
MKSTDDFAITPLKFSVVNWRVYERKSDLCSCGLADRPVLCWPQQFWPHPLGYSFYIHRPRLVGQLDKRECYEQKGVFLVLQEIGTGEVSWNESDFFLKNTAYGTIGAFNCYWFKDGDSNETNENRGPSFFVPVVQFKNFYSAILKIFIV